MATVPAAKEIVMGDIVVNVEMAAAWDGDEGDGWARDWERYDRGVRGHHRALLDAAAIDVPERVIDIGCGNGQTTCDAARAAHDGSALGVDLSSRMLERARERARAEGLGNASFVRGDAQVHPFDPSASDVALSRFGAMFFADPVAAFVNIGAALRPGGRLVMVAWRGIDDNEWVQCVFRALAVGRELPTPPMGAPGLFGLADPEAVRVMLTTAGFDGIDVVAVDQPFWMGTDAEDAFGFVRSTGIVRGLTEGLDHEQRARALDALHATIVEHERAEGVAFGSGAWLISARRPAR
jgi:SAM-dependent methyltransferase